MFITGLLHRIGDRLLSSAIELVGFTAELMGFRVGFRLIGTSPQLFWFLSFKGVLLDLFLFESANYSRELSLKSNLTFFFVAVGLVLFGDFFFLRQLLRRGVLRGGD